MSYEIERPLKRCPTHPGVIIEDIMESLGYTQFNIVKDLAAMIRCDEKAVRAILKGESGLGPDMAVRFGKLFKADPMYFLRMQNAYDVWHATNNINLDIIPSLET